MNSSWHFAVCPPITSLSTDISSETITVQTITLPYSVASSRLATKVWKLINRYTHEMFRSPKYLMLNYKRYCSLAAYFSHIQQSPFLPDEAFGLQIIIRDGPMVVAGDPKDDFMYQSQQKLYKKEKE